MAAVSIIAIASGIAIGYALFSARPNDAPTILSAIVAGRSVDVTISPDGAWLAAAVNRAIQVRRLDQPSWRELAGTTGAADRVFWSPDGRQLGFSAGTSLKRVDRVGSRAQTICFQAGSVITVGPAKRLFSRGMVEFPEAPFDVGAKGRFVMFQVDEPTATESQTIVNVLMNWTKLVK